MTSLADIPEHLRNKLNQTSFIAWLCNVPLDYSHKRTLASLWSRNTKIKLTRPHWAMLKSSSLPNPKPNAPTLPTPTPGR